MHPAERIVERGLYGAVAAVRRAKKRVEAFARRYKHLAPGELLTRVQAELVRVEPDVARALESGIVAAWITSARGPAREVPKPTHDHSDWLPPAAPPTPPFGPLWLAPSGDDSSRPIRWPAIEASARDLLARQVVTQADLNQLGSDAHNAAWSVARVATAEASASVRDAITHELLHGGGLRQFRRSVGSILEGAGLADHQIEAIYRTQTGVARAAGLRAVLDQRLVRSEFPYVRYSATHDARVRPDHVALERLGIQGTAIYRVEDPIIRRYWAPWSWNCRCIMIPYTIEDAAAAGVGEAREWLRTGVPPTNPAFVRDPEFPLPKGWPSRSDGRVRPVL